MAAFTMAKYNWKSDSRIKVDAQKAGELFEKLSQEQKLTPKNVLEESRDKNALLHNEFEWQDDIAAEKYRETQAAYLIRMIVISVEEPENKQVEIRAFVNLKNDGTGYNDIRTVMTEPNNREAMLKCAINELNAFRNKYITLENLSGIFAELDKLENNYLVS